MINLKSHSHERSRSARFITSAVLRGLVLAGLTFVAACGKGDGPTDPTTHGGDPIDQITPKKDLTGSWTLNISVGNAQIGLSCDSKSQVKLQQSGASITGQYTSGTITCTGPGGTVSGDVAGSFSGTVTGDQVTFEEDEGGFRFTGTVSSNANRIQGTISGSFDVGEAEPLVLNGSWTASR